MNLRDYANLDGMGLAELVRQREVSAAEVIEAAIRAIEYVDKTLNAVVIRNFENARERALAPIPNSPLAGVPFLLKDVNVFSHDIPTTFSCRFFANARPKPDSAIVSRWREAGLNIIGKTNTPEFAEDFVCEPTFRGPTLNPWNQSVTTGGSSGGAGAAVASGMVPVAHGTDLGGSIRIPAACCGVFGLKPTSGLNPQGPYYLEIAAGFNSDHVLTRSVRDSAAALDATASPLPGTRYQIAPKVSSYLRALETPVKSLRIGVCYHTPGGNEVDGSPGRAVSAVAEALQSLGHQIEDYRYSEDAMLGDWAESLWLIDIVHEVERQIEASGREPDKNELEALTHFARSHIASMSAMDLYRARQRAHEVGVILMESMQHLDLVLTPALGCDPVPVGALDSRTEKFDFATWTEDGHRFAPFSYICNVSGQPAASLPVQLQSDSQPSAVQLAGHHRDDHVILQVSAQLEEYFQWSTYRPPVWSGDF